jgi:putative tricarboxylic transport membrane protein
MEAPALVNRRSDLAVSVGVVGIGIIVILGSLNIRKGTVTQDPIGVSGVPRAVGVLLIVAGLLLIFRRIRDWAKTGRFVSSDGGTPDEEGYPVSPLRPVLFVTAALAWAALLPVAGYIIATTLLCAAVLASSRVKSVAKLVLVPLALVMTTWFIFDRAVGISLPGGPIGPFLDDLIPRLG